MSLFYALIIMVAPFASFAQDSKPLKLSKQAKAIHQQAILVDGHNDLPWQLRKRDDLEITKTDLRKNISELHTDIPRLKKGGVGLQFWSAYVPAETDKDGTAVKMTLEQIAVIRKMVKKYPDVFEMAYSSEDVLRIRKAGRIASMIGVEGGHSINNSMGVLQAYFDLGVRYMTLTHSASLTWADSATDEGACKGLCPFGERIVEEMNRLGMLVDISHVSTETMKDAIKISKSPVIASHSSAYTLAPHPRNIPDDVLKLIGKTGGVVMVNFYSGFIVKEGAEIITNIFDFRRKLKEKYPDKEEYQKAYDKWRKDNPIPRGSIETLVDHIEHIIKVAGIGSVGLGSDYDGVPVLPEKLEDVSTYPYITQVMIERGYQKEDIIKVLGGNAMRVLKKAEEVASEMHLAH